MYCLSTMATSSIEDIAAIGGDAGVDRALQLLRAEIVRTMALLGCRAISESTRERIFRSSHGAPTEEARNER